MIPVFGKVETGGPREFVIGEEMFVTVGDMIGERGTPEVHLSRRQLQSARQQTGETDRHDWRIVDRSFLIQTDLQRLHLLGSRDLLPKILQSARPDG
jgi:hypothetical protein